MANTSTSDIDFLYAERNRLIELSNQAVAHSLEAAQKAMQAIEFARVAKADYDLRYLDRIESSAKSAAMLAVAAADGLSAQIPELSPNRQAVEEAIRNLAKYKDEG